MSTFFMIKSETQLKIKPKHFLTNRAKFWLLKKQKKMYDIKNSSDSKEEDTPYLVDIQS